MTEEYILEKLMLTILAMSKQGKFIERGNTETPRGIPRTERIQLLGKRALELLSYLEKK